MQIVNGTYVGAAPKSPGLTALENIGGAVKDVVAEQKAQQVFAAQTLVKQVEDMYSQFGPDAFNPQYPGGEQRLKLLGAAGEAMKAASGGKLDPASWGSAFTSGVASPGQRANFVSFLQPSGTWEQPNTPMVTGGSATPPPPPPATALPPPPPVAPPQTGMGEVQKKGYAPSTGATQDRIEIKPVSLPFGGSLYEVWINGKRKVSYSDPAKAQMAVDNLTNFGNMQGDAKYARDTFLTPLASQAKATGSPAPNEGHMTPEALAMHEARTGDIHRPALIGDKEGIVNAEAMARPEIARAVAEWNKRYPVPMNGKSKPLPSYAAGRGPLPVVEQTPQYQQQMTEQQLLQARLAQGQPADAAAYDQMTPYPQVVDNAQPLSAYDQQAVAQAQTQAAQQERMRQNAQEGMPWRPPMAAGPGQKPQPGATYGPPVPKKAEGLFASLADTISKAKTEAQLGQMKKADATSRAAMQKATAAAAVLASDKAYQDFRKEKIDSFDAWMKGLDDRELTMYGFGNVAEAVDRQDKRAIEREKLRAQTAYWAGLLMQNESSPTASLLGVAMEVMKNAPKFTGKDGNFLADDEATYMKANPEYAQAKKTITTILGGTGAELQMVKKDPGFIAGIINGITGSEGPFRFGFSANPQQQSGFNAAVAIPTAGDAYLNGRKP